MKLIFNKQFLKYIVIGWINTGVTYISYIAILNFFNYNVSYLISYILGIVFSFVLNSKVVFKTQITLWKFIKYPVVYLTQFVLNWFFLYVLVDQLVISVKIAPLIVTVLSIPITFILSRTILSESRKKEQEKIKEL